MKTLVQKVIENYSRYLHEEELLEHHLEMRENKDMRNALVEMKIRINVVESWFELLNDTDERFALRQALLSGFNDTPAYSAAATMWMQQLVKSGIAPWRVRERAVEKIVIFASNHKEMMQTVFYDLLPASNNKGGFSL